MNILKNEKGQSLVEFAIILPILLLIVMAIAELAMMLNSYLTVQNISRETARLVSIGASDIAVQNMIAANSSNLNSQNLTVSITPAPADRTSGTSLTVMVTYNYNLIVPIISGILNNSIVLSAQTSMRIE